MRIAELGLHGRGCLVPMMAWASVGLEPSWDRPEKRDEFGSKRKKRRDIREKQRNRKKGNERRNER